jgi:hypothetical protein
MEQPAFNIHIPKPCHEDWHKMSPEEKGRHCQQCSMTVRDFTHMTRADAQRTAKQENTHCGRFRPDQLHSLGGGGQVAYRYPASRMRSFLLAFLVTFGFSAFALDAELLDELLPVQQNLQTTPLDQLLSEDPVPDSLQLFGIVLDAVSGEPLELVTVQAEWQGQVIYTTVSDTAGLFELHVPKAKREGLAIRATLGETMLLQENVPADIREMTILLNSGIELPTVVMVGNQVYRNDVSMGLIVEEPVVLGGITYHTTSCGHALDIGPENRYYHKLHDFIQMRSSEVFTKDW